MIHLAEKTHIASQKGINKPILQSYTTFTDFKQDK